MKKHSRTIIFIPGFKGSELVDQHDKLIWPNFMATQFDHQSQLSVNTLLEPKNTKSLHSRAVVSSVKVIPGLYHYDIYGKFIGFLEKNLPEDFNIVCFHYDWRQDIQSISQKLTQLVSQIIEQQDGEISLICHSLGGVIATDMLQHVDHGRISQIFFVSTPFQGALRPLLNLMHGSRLGFNRHLLSPTALASFSSVYYLLPRYGNAVAGESLFDVETWLKYKIGYWGQQPNSHDLKFLEKTLRRVHDFYEQLNIFHQLSGPTQLFFINNNTHKTSTCIRLSEHKIQYGLGDATVPQISLQAPEYFQGFQCKQYSINKPHSISFQDKEIRKIILEAFLMRC